MFIPKLSEISSILKEHGTPIFITDAETIRQQASIMQKAFQDLNTKFFYAIKANFNPHIVKIIKESGITGIDAVSPNEVSLALELGYKSDEIIFTPSNPSDEEMKFVGEKGVLQNLGSLSELRRFGQIFPGKKVSIRICPEIGAGENSKITTGQQNSKFGIMMEELPEVKNICTKYDLKMVGIHSHIGSGFYKVDEFKLSVQAVCAVANNFPSIEFLDFGGGFGVNYHLGKSDINLANFSQEIKPIIEKFEQENGQKIEIRLEPGKFLVSNSTAFIMQATTIKQKDNDIFIGCDAGFGQYIRPAMYESWQDFVNLSNPTGEKIKVQIAGNVCETCDIFNAGVSLPKPKEGDILAMLVAGGYGSSMSSNYNLRPNCPEILLDKGNYKLIRKTQSYQQIMENFGDYQK